MVRWLKWKFIWCIVYIVVTYCIVKSWFWNKGFYWLVYCCRMYIVADFTLGCLVLPAKYNPRYMYNFYYLCIYLVFMVVLYIMLGKLLNSIREDRDGKTT